MLPIPKIEIIAAQRIIKIYLPSFPFIFRSLNLSESKGILVTIIIERNKESIVSQTGDAMNAEIKEEPEKYPPITKVITARAFAGVGNPLKKFVCVVSRLNLASLNAAQTGIIAGIKNST